MSHNPYTPPAAPVADSPEIPPHVRPVSVRAALWFFWIALGIGLFIWTKVWPDVNTGMISSAKYLGMLIGILIPVWFYLKIQQGRNWARIAVLVITLARAVLVYAPKVKDWRMHYFVDRTMFFALIGEQALAYTALFLVFFPGREWFKRRTS